MPRRLPFLNGLPAFDAAARHGSFAAGGKELHVSPAAVSRSVRLLEERLGVALFERGANRLRLTEAGRRFQDGLDRLFGELETLTDRIRREAARPVITIGVGPSFAAHWLIPRLPDWQRLAPQSEVRVTTGGAAAAFDEGWSCGVRLGDGTWPGFVARRLFAAELRPVCAPRLARRLREPRDLAALPLLRVAHAPEDWPRWLSAHRLPSLAARGPVFDFYGQAQQAAEDGLGVAMGLTPYIEDALREGRLVAPFPASVPKGACWYLLHRPGRDSEPGFAAFRDWMLAAARG
ncbi:MAG: LysR family transcriptional regulator [Acetobacteraceae bacterium]|nr:LysR family transcriptional regulator [Acetobacteraceae bacterium]